jgi:hypothetical protein
MRLLNPSRQVRGGEKPGNATPMGRFAFSPPPPDCDRARVAGVPVFVQVPFERLGGGGGGGAAPARARHTGRRAPSGSGTGRDLNLTVSSVRASYLRPRLLVATDYLTANAMHMHTDT